MSDNIPPSKFESNLSKLLEPLSIQDERALEDNPTRKLSNQAQFYHSRIERVSPLWPLIPTSEFWITGVRFTKATTDDVLLRPASSLDALTLLRAVTEHPVSLEVLMALVGA